MKTIIWNHLDEERGAFYVAIFTDGKNAVCPWRDLPSRNYQQACNKQPLQKINKRNGKHGVNQKQKFKSAEAENGKSVSCEPRDQESGFVHRKTTVWISVSAPVLGSLGQPVVTGDDPLLPYGRRRRFRGILVSLRFLLYCPLWRDGRSFWIAFGSCR